MPACVQVCCENVRVFVYRAVLYDRFIAFADLADLVKPAVQKIDLQVKRPLRHIAVKVPQVRILIDRLK
jgi:hypothetical protein